MPSIIDRYIAQAAGVMVEYFGERDGDGNLQPVVITLPDGLIVLWDCVVHELSQRWVERNREVVMREACLLSGASNSDLRMLPLQTTVLVPKHGAMLFQVDPETTRYGEMVTLGLLRAPLVRAGNQNDARY